jgi:hypothetical protein
MSSFYLPLSKNEFNSLNSRRVTLEHTNAKEYIDYKEFNEPIDLSESRNPSTFIKPLYFSNCVFNEKINVSSYQTAGNIFFESCIFNGDVKFLSENTESDKECRFNKNLAIHCVNVNTALCDFKVNGSFTISGKVDKLCNINCDEQIQNQKIIVNTNGINLNLENIFSNEIEVNNNGEGITKLIAIHTNTLLINKSIHLENSKINTLEFINLPDSQKSLSVTEGCEINLMLLPINLFEKIDIANINILKIVSAAVGVLPLSAVLPLSVDNSLPLSVE